MNEVVRKWKSVVNSVVKSEVRDEMIVCGKATEWREGKKYYKENITS